MVVLIGLSVLIAVGGVHTQDCRDPKNILLFSDSNTRSVKSICVTGGDITSELPDQSLGEYQNDIAYDSDRNILYSPFNRNVSFKSFRLGAPDPLIGVIYLSARYIDRFNAIAIDAVKKYLYFGAYDSIYRVSTDGGDIERLVGGWNIEDIALHLQLGLVYWTDYENGTLMRVPVTDPAGKEIVVSKIDRPSGLYIDTNTNKIYWNEFYGGNIYEASLDGGHKRILVTLPNKVTYYMTGINGHLYVTGKLAEGVGTIYHVYNGEYTALQLNSNSVLPRGIVVMQDNLIGDSTENTMVQQATTTITPMTTMEQSNAATTTMDEPSTQLANMFQPGLTDTTTPQTSTSQAEDTFVLDPQTLGWIIGGVVITLVICATIIAALIILTKRTMRTANNSDTATKTSLPAETESDKLPEEPPHTYAHFNDPEYETINQTQEDRNETEPTESQADRSDALLHDPHYNNVEDSKESQADISYALRHDPHYNNVEDSKRPKSYESTTEGESDVYIGPYLTPTYNTTYDNTSQWDQNTYAAPFMAINTDTAYESTAQGERNTYLAPYTSINTAHQSP